MTKSKGQNSYRSILKGFSFFGSVQVLQIAVNLVRGKLVAMFLGPEGMGISALFTSSAQTVQRFSSLGLNLAIVKEVAATRESPGAFASTMATARHLILLTSLLGALVCVLFSGWLSRVTFGTGRWATAFMLLGVMVFLTVAGNGMLALLQGMHEVKRISKASLVSALTGLLAGVPLYWWLGYDGIVPAMTVLALAMAVFYLIELRSALRERGFRHSRFSWQSHRPLVVKLVGLGLMLMVSDLIGSGCTYLLNLFIKTFGGLDALGLYQGANSLTNQYSGMIFAALALDYFPRLSAVASDNDEMHAVVNRQIEIVAYIITPVVAALLLSAPLVIRLLLTSNFNEAIPLMRWMGTGVLIKALMFPLGYIAFAKDNKKVFFWLEGVTGNLLTLVMSAAGFYMFGLIGLGYGLVADCLICFAIYYFVNRSLYGFRFSRGAVRVIVLSALLASGVFAAYAADNHLLRYSLMSIGFLASLSVSAISLKGKLKRDRQCGQDDSVDDA